MHTDPTYQALNALRTALPDLADAVHPGTPRRWAQRDLSPEQRRRMDAQAVTEREAKERNLAAGITALGTGRAPLNLAVLDALADMTAAVAELEGAVCDRLALTPLRGASTAARITRLVGLLDRIAEQDDLAEHVQAEAVRLARYARLVLGDVESVRRLNGRCPLCDARSLRAFPEKDIVLCINRACRCGDETCGCHRPRPDLHVWPYDRWSLLAQVLADQLGEAS
ncbi:hypothetical protein HNP84_000212 [Thermocatellispora tengchongensis]|uniref:Uncharacterized protein n=1 Tax=Thermocatellispora tengchongensis TaxID=1073253 RepID=A0A840NPR6_9ACTN|nr:hypothetical protein [Thermocatellispora tengchongensis]MBB5130524.1 hypothetical protein [Thermocatellispora tengchongensis]